MSNRVRYYITESDDRPIVRSVPVTVSTQPANDLMVFEKKNDIAEKIANGKRQGEMVKFITKLRAEAIIEWKNDEIKKAYEVGLKQEAEQPQP